MLIIFWIFFSVSLDFGFSSGSCGWHLRDMGKPADVVSEYMRGEGQVMLCPP
jgi:hypothetical protein